MRIYFAAFEGVAHICLLSFISKGKLSVEPEVILVGIASPDPFIPSRYRVGIIVPLPGFFFQIAVLSDAVGTVGILFRVKEYQNLMAGFILIRHYKKQIIKVVNFELLGKHI